MYIFIPATAELQTKFIRMLFLHRHFWATAVNGPIVRSVVRTVSGCPGTSVKSGVNESRTSLHDGDVVTPRLPSQSFVRRLNRQFAYANEATGIS